MTRNSIYIEDLKIFLGLKMNEESEGFDNLSKENHEGALRSLNEIYNYLVFMDKLITKLERG